MSFYPFENFYIVTNLTPEEVEKRLARDVGPKKGFSFSSMFSREAVQYFAGFVAHGIFQFERVISYQNSFLPTIKGTIEPYLNGSRLHVKMRMQVGVIVFMCIWLGMAVLFGLIAMTQNYSKESFLPGVLIPLAMIAFGYTLATGAFKYESSKAKDKLLEILEGEMEGK